jgi:hypothetical protein
MATRPFLFFVLAGIFASMGASYRTQNFIVEAPTQEIAERMGQWAEYYRKEKALQWLGREMPPWPEPCPLHIKVTRGSAGGATSFNFEHGVWQTMEIEGNLERLQNSVLPHEVTHTVFAHYFRCPVPRWADEGGAVLSEDELERNNHDLMVRQILNSGRSIALRSLFSLREYPREVGALYAEGYSVSDFLVGSSSRRIFLDFVAHGMQYGWDSAVRTHYRYQNVEQLQESWLNYLRTGIRPQSTLVARNESAVPTDPASRVVVRLTAPPTGYPQGLVARGQAPSPESDATNGWSNLPRRVVATQPGYLPDYEPYVPGQRQPAENQWQSAGARLGQPVVEAPPQPSPLPNNASPVGYPR